MPGGVNAVAGCKRPREVGAGPSGGRQGPDPIRILADASKNGDNPLEAVKRAGRLLAPVIGRDTQSVLPTREYVLHCLGGLKEDQNLEEVPALEALDCVGRAVQGAPGNMFVLEGLLRVYKHPVENNVGVFITNCPEVGCGKPDVDLIKAFSLAAGKVLEKHGCNLSLFDVSRLNCLHEAGAQKEDEMSAHTGSFMFSACSSSFQGVGPEQRKLLGYYLVNKGVPVGEVIEKLNLAEGIRQLYEMASVCSVGQGPGVGVRGLPPLGRGKRLPPVGQEGLSEAQIAEIAEARDIQPGNPGRVWLKSFHSYSSGDGVAPAQS